MNIPPQIDPPSTKKELFRRLQVLIQHGVYEMPTTKYVGTGGPGLYLEDLLGLTTGNKDIPDSVGWEIKYYTPKTNLVTLFHKEPRIIQRLYLHFIHYHCFKLVSVVYI